MPVGQVQTVTGTVDPKSLGATLVREHVLGFATRQPAPIAAGECVFYEKPLSIDMLGAVSLGTANRDNETLDDEDTARAELELYASLGGRTIADTTGPAQGRDPLGLRRIAEATGVNVVMSTGTPTSDDANPARLIAEITAGIDGVRAGLIGPLASSNPDDSAQRALLQMVAAAARETGAPVLLDVHEPNVTANAVALLIAEGVPPTSIAVGRCGVLALDAASLEPLVAQGIFVLFDQLGRIPNITTEVADHDVAVAVADLARRGHAEQILLSQSIARKCETKAYGGNGYGFILEQFMRYLAMFGLDETVANAITVENPARFLRFKENA